MADDENDPLNALLETEKLIIKQEVSLLEVAAQTAANALDLDALGNLGETANKYDIFTDNGGLKFKVIETSEACGFTGCCPTGRICCNPNHALQLHVFAPSHSPKDAIMFVDRPCKCGQCISCCSICRQEMRVYRGADDGPAGGDGDAESQIAYIQQPFLGGGFSPQLQVMEREGDEDVMFNVQAKAMCCIGGICCDHTFDVTDSEGAYMGKIVKEAPESLGEFAKELGTDADRFTLYVNPELEKEKKAAMLASLHLLDYMFFESEGAANVDLTSLADGQCPELNFKCCDCYCCGCLCPCSMTCGGGDDDKEEEEEKAPTAEKLEGEKPAELNEYGSPAEEKFEGEELAEVKEYGAPAEEKLEGEEPEEVKEYEAPAEEELEEEPEEPEEEEEEEAPAEEEEPEEAPAEEELEEEAEEPEEEEEEAPAEEELEEEAEEPEEEEEEEAPAEEELEEEPEEAPAEEELEEEAEEPEEEEEEAPAEEEPEEEEPEE